jgi:hypothetical protein
MLSNGEHDYGLGIGLGGEGKTKSFSHAGGNEGFRCILVAYAEIGQGVVVMTNGDRGDLLFNEILRAIATEYDWPDYRPTVKTRVHINPSIYAAYVGIYDEEGTAVTISAEADQLFIQTLPMGPQLWNLYPAAEDKFFMLDGDIEVSFTKDAKGKTTDLRIHAGQDTAIAKKVP